MCRHFRTFSLKRKGIENGNLNLPLLEKPLLCVVCRLLSIIFPARDSLPRHPRPRLLLSSPISILHLIIAKLITPLIYLFVLMKPMRPFVEASWEDTVSSLLNSGSIALANCGERLIC